MKSVLMKAVLLLGIVTLPMFGASISGTVTDAINGTPLNGALVMALGYNTNGDSLFYETTTGFDGGYLIENMADGEYFISADLNGYIRQQAGGILLSGNTQLQIDFTLSPVGTLNNRFSGKVQNAITGEFIADALISLQQNGAISYQQMTDAGGNFAFDDVEIGQYLVVVEKDSFQTSPFISLYFDVNTQINNFFIQLTPVGVPTGLGSLTGVITDSATGLPVYPAFVEVHGNTPIGDSLFFLEVNQPSGIYYFTGIPAGTYYGSVFAPGYENQNFGPVVLQDNRVDTLNFALAVEPTPLIGTISGNVKYDSSGAPVANAFIELLNVNGNIIDRAFTDFQGNYSITTLTGDYYVAVRVGLDTMGTTSSYREFYDDVQTFNEATVVTVTENAITDGIDFGVPESATSGGSATLSGTVRENDPNGSAIYPTFIELIPIDTPSGFPIEPVTNNPDGSYSVPNIEPGLYMIFANANGYQPFHSPELVITSGENQFDILLESLFNGPTGWITGQVTFDGSGTPVNGAVIELIGGNVNFSAVTNPQGFYAVQAPEGDYVVAATYYAMDSLNIFPMFYREYFDDAQTLAEATPVSVVANDTTGNINFGVPDSIPPINATFTGTVTDDSGNPIEGALVTIEGSFFGFPIFNDSLIFRSVTDNAGNYSITANTGLLPFNVFSASAGADGYRIEYWEEQPAKYLADPIFVTGDTLIQNVNFTLSESTVGENSISGFVLGGNGFALNNATVIATSIDHGLMFMAQSDSSGFYTISGLEAGEYAVLFAADGYVPEFYNDVLVWEDATPVPAFGNVFSVDAFLTPANIAPATNAMMTGAITDDFGEPVSGVLVTLMDGSGEIAGYDLSDAQGNYQMMGLHSGQLTVRASKVGYQSRTELMTYNSGNGSIMVMNLNLSATPLSVDPDDSESLPKAISLEQNYPNPFNPNTTITFALPTAQFAKLAIYNVIGQKVKELVNRELPAGTYQFNWDGTDLRGNGVSSGIYFYSLEAGDVKLVKKMMLNR